MATMGLRAQNGNVVVSDVKVYDMENGTGMIVVHVSGNLAEFYPGGTFTISGDLVAGGTASGGIGDNTRVIIEPITPGNGGGNGNGNGNQQVVLAGVFPMRAATGNESDEVQIDGRLLRRIGNGLDYTYSRVGRIKRDYRGI